MVEMTFPYREDKNYDAIFESFLMKFKNGFLLSVQDVINEFNPFSFDTPLDDPEKIGWNKSRFDWHWNTMAEGDKIGKIRFSNPQPLHELRIHRAEIKKEEPEEIIRVNRPEEPEVIYNKDGNPDLFKMMLHNMRNGKLPTEGILPEPSDETMEQWKARNFDPISHPAHYTDGRKYEPRKVISDWGLNFNLGNALKYISRAGRKDNAVEDLKKAIQYLQFEIEELEEP